MSNVFIIFSPFIEVYSLHFAAIKARREGDDDYFQSMLLLYARGFHSLHFFFQKTRIIYNQWHSWASCNIQEKNSQQQQFFYYHRTIYTAQFNRCFSLVVVEKKTRRKMIMKCLEMRSLLQACGMFYWKILCCHDYGSTIDINDVLHYYQFHFVPDFLSFYAAMTAQFHSTMVALDGWREN